MHKSGMVSVFSPCDKGSCSAVIVRPLEERWENLNNVKIRPCKHSQRHTYKHMHVCSFALHNTCYPLKGDRKKHKASLHLSASISNSPQTASQTHTFTLGLFM